MEIFVSFQSMVRLFKGQDFIDPGSRASINMWKWYIVGEGGHSLCTPYGFRTLADLKNMAQLTRAVTYEPSYMPAVGPEGLIDHERAGAWDRPLLEGSIVLGRDLFHYWASNHPARLVECNREMLHHG